jgi:excisionase family DNA binding protein
MTKIVSVQELAKVLGMTKLTIYRLANAGEIPGKKIGKQWRFDMDKIKQIFDEDGSPRTKKPGKKKQKSRGKK